MRKPKKVWAYYVVTHDWPVGVGTSSEALSRARRYAALRVMGEPKQPVVDGEETTDE
jgi:hypothetical protein